MEEDDIAAAMGFSSFGGAKKRKYDEASSPKAKHDASGANSTKLGVRAKAKAVIGDDNDAFQEEQEPDYVENDVVFSTEAPPTNRKGKQKQPAGDSLAAFLSRGMELPEKSTVPHAVQHPSLESNPINESEMTSFGGPSISRAELNALRHGVPTEDGHVAYFQPSFVEDPWEKLGKSQR